MIEVIVGCLFPILLTPNDIPEIQQCLTTKEKVEYVVHYGDVVSRYFKEEDIPKALNIIYCESSGIAEAVGVNTNGTRDVGLWQFNDDTWAWLKQKLNIISNRTNPEVSTAVASWLVYNDGWFHWNASKHCWKGADNKLLYVRVNK
jgi:hypothetical protein